MRYIQNNKSTKLMITERHEARFYRALSLISVVIMITAAYMTYGYQKREILITPEVIEEKVAAESQHIEVTGDLSLVPSDTEVRKILNKELPNTCDDCDDKPLSCLDDYTMNKILMTGERGESILSAEILTGKVPKKYYVLIDLSHNDRVIKKGGEIDKKECTEEDDSEETAETTDIYIGEGDDPMESDYVIVE